jgi:uncharacterized protein (DUF983 family)
MSNFKPCPQCGAESAEKMSFTWWGGIVGPKLLSHVKCTSCAKQYNGKSGKDNTVGIVIYSIVMLGIVAAFLVVIIAAAIMIAMS